MGKRESRRERKSGNTEVVLLLSPKCSIIGHWSLHNPDLNPALKLGC